MQEIRNVIQIEGTTMKEKRFQYTEVPKPVVKLRPLFFYLRIKNMAYKDKWDFPTLNLLFFPIIFLKNKHQETSPSLALGTCA